MTPRTGTETAGEQATDPGAARVAERPAPRQVSRGPALVSLGLAGLVGIGGFAWAAATSHPGSSAPPSTTKHLAGVHLGAVPATQALKAITRGGEPPTDIAGALVVPASARRTGSHCGAAINLYDCTVDLTVRAKPSQVVAFYRAELRHAGWRILAVDATTGKGTVVYAQHASNDGYYWEVGVAVDPATPSITPALSGNGESAPTSTVSLRVLEKGDAG